ncbi:hypothetical protein T484DRAFT_1933157 [Baffinella frigidus]|nr:hypothetical protein T484DRAFT_1933157 [Cryptophyta sp. CCMP2293]
MPTPDQGWSWWWRYVLMTNIGWFPGILTGMFVGRFILPHETSYLVREAVQALICSASFGIAQAGELREFLGGRSGWVLATMLGWTTGVVFARWLLTAHGIALPLSQDASLVAGIAGTFLGAAQAVPLSRKVEKWWLWVAMSAVGWATLFPGALAGIGMIYLARNSARKPKEYKGL